MRYKVLKRFDITFNEDIISLEGSPEYVGTVYACFSDKPRFTKDDIRKVSDVKGTIYVSFVDFILNR